MTEEQFKILVEMQAAVNRMEHELFGNGQPGRLKEIEASIDKVNERVDAHENFKSTIKGAFATISTLVGALGLTELYHLFLGTGRGR